MLECYEPQTCRLVGLSQVIALIGEAPSHNSGGDHQLAQRLGHNIVVVVVVVNNRQQRKCKTQHTWNM